MCLFLFFLFNWFEICCILFTGLKQGPFWKIFRGFGLKTCMINHIFWSEIDVDVGFGDQPLASCLKMG